MSVFDLSRHGLAPALLDAQGRRLSYQQLGALSAHLGDLLSQGGKSCLLVLTRNNLESVAGYLAALESGNCALLVDDAGDPELRDQLIRLYDPEFVWGPDAGETAAPFRFGRYALTRRPGAERAPLHADLALLLSTSGSTGSAKLVRLSAAAVAANARSIAHYLGLDGAHRPLAHLPLHYCYGLSVLNSHLLVGAAVRLTESSVTRKEFWDDFVSGGCSSLAGVPYTFEMLERVGFADRELPTLKYLTQAGGRLDLASVSRWAGICAAKGINFFVMYGATEATARMAYLPPAQAARIPGSIGRAIPGGEFALLDERGAELGLANRQGELVYRGPNVMMGYAACRSDLSRGDELAGTLATGDLAYRDEEGYFYISGRRSRFLKILGKRVGLCDIEEHLAQAGWNCLCGGSDDGLLVACRREGADGKLADLRLLKRTLCTRFGIPSDLVQVFPIEEIPRTSAGKIRYGELFSASNLAPIRRDHDSKQQCEGAVRQAGAQL